MPPGLRERESLARTVGIWSLETWRREAEAQMASRELSCRERLSISLTMKSA